MIILRQREFGNKENKAAKRTWDLAMAFKHQDNWHGLENHPGLGYKPTGDSRAKTDGLVGSAKGLLNNAVHNWRNMNKKYAKDMLDSSHPFNQRQLEKSQDRKEYIKNRLRLNKQYVGGDKKVHGDSIYYHP